MFNKYNSKYPVKSFRKTSSSNKVINRQNGRTCSSEAVTLVTEANLIFQLLPERILFKQNGRLTIYTIRKFENAVERKKSMVSQFAIKLNDNVKFVFVEIDETNCIEII